MDGNERVSVLVMSFNRRPVHIWNLDRQAGYHTLLFNTEICILKALHVLFVGGGDKLDGIRIF